jgi:hypothetical protein
VSLPTDLIPLRDWADIANSLSGRYIYEVTGENSVFDSRLLGEEGGVLTFPPSLACLRLLAQRRKVDDWAADEGRGDFQRSLPGGNGGQDIVILA